MKQLFTFVALVFAASAMNAQIFINTGNENLERYKKENPNLEIFEEGKTNEPPKAIAPAKEEKEKVAPVATPPAKPVVKAAPTPAAPKAPVTPAAPAAPTAVTTPTSPVGDVPPNAEPGKCYARCLIPDQFEFKEEQVLDKPASFKMEVTPATYKTVTDTVVVRKAYTKKIAVPAVYQTTSEDVMVTPATTKWQKGKADASCLSANPADCQVLCLVEVPAVYKKVTKKVLVTPASTREEEIPADVKITTRKVVDVPAKNEKIEIPATYKAVMKKSLTAKGGYQEWKEVLCADKLNEQRILAIQKALKAEGYDPGPFDNMFGAKTKEALIKFQQDKGLPVGNLNLETLKVLGVN